MNKNKSGYIKLGVAGIGVMGSFHLENIGRLKNVKLQAIYDIDKEKVRKKSGKYGIAGFTGLDEFFERGGFDSVLIASPHYYHKDIALKAFEYGIHVLTEKPVGVHVEDIQIMIDAWKNAKKKFGKIVFAAMFQQRTLEQWKKIKEILKNGELGQLVRVTWIITDWFRTQVYYDSSDWKATWKGEGGGVLLNQSPHQLDLFQWFFGVPDRITAFSSFGKYHNIEVEDEVTAYMEYDNGLIAHFITSTAESPGTNRLEIAGENGKLVFEDQELIFYRNSSSMLEYIRTSDETFGSVEYKKEIQNFPENAEFPHNTVISNFADSVLYGKPLIAPAQEGLNSVSLANAMIQSSVTGRTVKLPLDAREYSRILRELIEKSTFSKKETRTPVKTDIKF